MKLKKHISLIASLALAGALASSPAQSTVIGLFDWAVNIDGVVSEPNWGDPIPPEVDDSSFNDSTGLGSLTVTISGAGGHTFDAFFDHEIDQDENTFFNEYGDTSGTPAAGQSWEIDEPGYIFGDIYDNFLDSDLDNTNNVPAGLEDDVSMAMGWDFALAADEIATIDLLLSLTAPASGFYLQQTDPESEDSSTSTIYLSSSISIGGGLPPGIPEPGIVWLMGAGLAGLGVARRRRGLK